MTSRIKIVFAFIGILVFFIVKFVSIPDISPEAHDLLAIIAAAVVFWIAAPIPIYFTGILISVVPWALGIIPINIAFSGFASNTFWFLFAAMGMAGCIGESGVARRIALWLMSKVEPTFNRIFLVIAIIMFVLGYILPLAAARVALMLAILTPIIPLFGAPIKSNIGKAITLAVVMLGLASAWQILTGGAPGLILWGVLSDIGYEVSWLQWAAIMFIPTVLMFTIMYIAIKKLFPAEVDQAPGGKERVAQELAKLGPMTPVEKRALVILGLIVLLWLTEPLHQLGTDVVGICGVFLFLIPGIGTTSFETFVKKLVPWPLMIFIGAILSLAAMAASTGIDSFIDNVVVAPIYSIAGNNVLFVISTWMLNTVTGSLVLLMPTLPLFVAPITSSAITAGVNPIIGALVYLSCAPLMFFYYSVPFFPLAMTYGAIETKDWIKAGFIFFLACPIVHIICFFTWYPLLELIGII